MLVYNSIADIYDLFHIKPINNVITEENMKQARKVYLSFHPDKFSGDMTLFAQYTTIYDILNETYLDQEKYVRHKDTKSLLQNVNKYLKESNLLDAELKSTECLEDSNETFNEKFLSKIQRNNVDDTSWKDDNQYVYRDIIITNSNDGVNEAFNNLRDLYHKKKDVSSDVIAFDPIASNKYTTLKSAYHDNVFLDHEIFADVSANVQLDRITKYKSFQITYDITQEDARAATEFHEMKDKIYSYKERFNRDDNDLNKYLL